MATACVAVGGVDRIPGGTCILKLCSLRAVPLADIAIVADVCGVWYKHYESISVDQAIFQLLVRADVPCCCGVELV